MTCSRRPRPRWTTSKNCTIEFDDWQLALAAYNWGEGNVRRAIARNRAKGLPTDFASLTGMPVETRNYLPKLQAVKNIVADPLRYGVQLSSIPDAPFFAVVKTDREMDVKRAVELAELSTEEFLALNPQHNRPVIAGADEYTILLPIDKAEIFAAKLDLLNQPLVSWQAYRVKGNETLPQIAVKFGMSVETLRAVNGIGPKARVPVGHALLVPSQRPSNDLDVALAQTVFTTVPSGRTFYYTVRRGDTLASIAARYDVTAPDLRRWNNMTQNHVNVGQKLRVTSEVPTARAAPKALARPARTRGSSMAPPRANAAHHSRALSERANVTSRRSRSMPDARAAKSKPPQPSAQAALAKRG